MRIHGETDMEIDGGIGGEMDVDTDRGIGGEGCRD